MGKTNKYFVFSKLFVPTETTSTCTFFFSHALQLGCEKPWDKGGSENFIQCGNVIGSV